MVTAGCSSSSNKAKATTTTTRARATTTSVVPRSTTSSTSSSSATTAPAPPPTQPTAPPDGETASKRFFAAWLAHDNGGLSANGTADATSQAIAQYAHTSGASWVFSNCQGGAGTEYCTYVRAAEDVVMRASNATSPHLVYEFDWKALDAPAIAEQFISAWQFANGAAERALATSAAVSQLDASGAPRDGAWQAPTCEGTAGSFYCTSMRNATSKLIVRVGDVQVPHQVIGVTYTP
jgi:hypothetical protein